MVVLGIVLIVLAVVFGLGVSVSSSDSTTLEVFGVDFGVVGADGVLPRAPPRASR